MSTDTQPTSETKSGCACGKPKNHCDPCSTEQRPKEEKFRDAYILVVDGVECSVGDSKEFLYIGARCLTVREARELRDWLNGVLPS